MKKIKYFFKRLFEFNIFVHLDYTVKYIKHLYNIDHRSWNAKVFTQWSSRNYISSNHTLYVIWRFKYQFSEYFIMTILITWEFLNTWSLFMLVETFLLMHSTFLYRLVNEWATQTVLRTELVMQWKALTKIQLFWLA